MLNLKKGDTKIDMINLAIVYALKVLFQTDYYYLPYIILTVYSYPTLNYIKTLSLSSHRLNIFILSLPYQFLVYVLYIEKNNLEVLKSKEKVILRK